MFLTTYFLIMNTVHLAVYKFFIIVYTSLLVRNSFSISAFTVGLFLASKDIIEHSRLAARRWRPGPSAPVVKSQPVPQSLSPSDGGTGRLLAILGCSLKVVVKIK